VQEIKDAGLAVSPIHPIYGSTQVSIDHFKIVHNHITTIFSHQTFAFQAKAHFGQDLRWLMSIALFITKNTRNSRDRHQLRIARVGAAEDLDLPVHPQPTTLDGERERSTDDRNIESEGDTVLEVPGYTSELDCRKEGNTGPNGDGEGLLLEVELYKDLNEK
jgi:hypothetical protein